MGLAVVAMLLATGVLYATHQVFDFEVKGQVRLAISTEDPLAVFLVSGDELVRLSSGDSLDFGLVEVDYWGTAPSPIKKVVVKNTSSTPGLVVVTGDLADGVLPLFGLAETDLRAWPDNGFSLGAAGTTGDTVLGWLGLEFLSLSEGSKQASIIFRAKDLPAVLSAHIWPMFHHDLGHAGRSVFSGPRTGAEVKWSYLTGGQVYSSPAIGSDDRIYVGSRDGQLYAFNSSGDLEWGYRTLGQILSSPALGPDGAIYVGSTDGSLYAFRHDGTLLWTYPTGGSIIDSSPAVGSDGTIYVGSTDDHLYAINSDGTRRWRYETLNDVNSSPSIGPDGTIYIGSFDRGLYALTPDGALK